MLLAEVLLLVIEDGIASIVADTTSPADAARREGGVAGFEACRDKEPGQLRDLLHEAAQLRIRAERSGGDALLRSRWYETQIDYVARVMSAALVTGGLPPIVTVTPQAMLRYAQLVGVEDSQENRIG